MKGHHGRVWKGQALFGEEVEDGVFARGFAPIGFENESDGSERVAFGVGEGRAEFDEEI